MYITFFVIDFFLSHSSASYFLLVYCSHHKPYDGFRRTFQIFTSPTVFKHTDITAMPQI